MVRLISGFMCAKSHFTLQVQELQRKITLNLPFIKALGARQIHITNQVIIIARKNYFAIEQGTFHSETPETHPHNLRVMETIHAQEDSHTESFLQYSHTCHLYREEGYAHIHLYLKRKYKGNIVIGGTI